MAVIGRFMAKHTQRQGGRRNGAGERGPGNRGPALDLRLDASDRVAHGGPDRAPPKRRKPGAKASPPKRRKKKPQARGLIARTMYWGLVLGIWGAIALVCLVGYHAAQLPQMSSWTVPERPPNARLVSVHGELLANRGATGGEAMRLEEMSPYIPMAVIAIEDRRFKQHFGIDPFGLARAMAVNAWSGRFVQGGSTLTQQLAKNLFLEPERTIGRKVQEAVLALWLETAFSKDDILELYLNRVYFGAGAYGVDAAARRYFGKSASEVTLGEAAMLAGLLRAPSRLSPARNPDGAKARAQVVLAAMRRAGAISDAEAKAASTLEADQAKRYWRGSQHYAADMAMKEVRRLIGPIERDLVVETTIDLGLQKRAGRIIAETIAAHGAKRKVGQGALIAMTPHGAIRALVGGREYASSQFNRAVDARRQPGSAFKPILFLAALEAGRTPGSVRQDAPVRIGQWTPANYDREFRGPVTLEEALALSLNTVAAQLVMEVGPKTVAETAHRLGIASPLQRNASIALGTSEVSLMELTAAYAPFANGGTRAAPHIVTRIATAEGEVLYERPERAAPLVVGGRELGMMNSMMRTVLAEGTGKSARLAGRPAAGKTGTTQNSRDALFVGYTAQMVAGIWYGNDDGAPMRDVTGGSLPAQGWARLMAAAHKGLPVADLPGLLPERIAAIPTPRPPRQVAAAPAPAGGEVTQSGGVATSRRPAASGGPRPQADLGGAPNRPRNILDLLFGS